MDNPYCDLPWSVWWIMEWWDESPTPCEPIARMLIVGPASLRLRAP